MTVELQPLVTIAIPVYNRGIYLHEAIQSVLCQTYLNIELLVVDDASEEDIEGLVRSYSDPRIRFVRNDKNLGMASNWNRCLSLAHGDIVNVLHSDDVLTVNSVERVVTTFAHYAGLGMVCSGPNRVEERIPAGHAAAMVAVYVPPVSSVFLSRQSLVRCGLYDPSYAYSPDLEYFPRIARFLDVAWLEGVAVGRYHSTRAMLRTWRRGDFLQEYEKVRVAAWQHAGLNGVSLWNHLQEDLAQACLYIADVLWRYGQERGDRSLGRHYYRMSRKYMPKSSREPIGNCLLIWSTLMPYGYKIAKPLLQSIYRLQGQIRCGLRNVM